MANEIRIDNINSIFGEAASIDDSDYIYIYKTSTHTLCRVTKSLLNLAVGGGGLSPSDIVDDLITGGRAKALSAEQGKALKEMIDSIETSGVVVDTELDSESEHPLANSAIVLALSKFVESEDLVDIDGVSVAGKKIVVANGDKRIPYSVVPSMVLASINFNPEDNNKVQSLIGNSFFYMNNFDGYIRHYITGTEYVDQPVSENVFYYNIEDGKFYRWTNRGMENIAMGGDVSVVVVDNLTTNDSEKALSAAQGKKLNDEKVDKNKMKTINNNPLFENGGGNIIVPTANADGRLDYKIQPRVVVENIGAALLSDLGYQNWKDSNIGKSFFIGSKTKIYSVYNDSTDSVHGATTAQDPDDGAIYYNKGVAYIDHNGNSHNDTYAAGFYRWDASLNSGAGGFVPISVGGGGAANIQVVENEGQASNNGIYFFVYSPSQAVGFFNSLLHGDIDGESYEQETLYDVQKLKYKSVEVGAGDITAVENNICYKGVRTPLKKYGEVVLSNTTKIADTADTALISFMVARPFYATTNVRISFDTTKVDVYRLSNGIWSKITNNTSLSFLPNGQASEECLMVIRKGISDYGNITTTLVSVVGFNNGYETKEVKVVYSPTKVWYKDGSMYNWSVGVANSLENDFGSVPARITSTDNNVLTIDGTNDRKYCPLVKNVSFDLSRYSVFYAVILDRASVWTDCVAYLPNWGGASNSQERLRAYAASSQLADSTLRHEEFDILKAKYGFFVLNCFIHDKRRFDVVNMNLYIGKAHGQIRVKEFGVITYDETQL